MPQNNNDLQANIPLGIVFLKGFVTHIVRPAPPPPPPGGGRGGRGFWHTHIVAPTKS